MVVAGFRFHGWPMWSYLINLFTSPWPRKRIFSACPRIDVRMCTIETLQQYSPLTWLNCCSDDTIWPENEGNRNTRLARYQIYQIYLQDNKIICIPNHSENLPVFIYMYFCGSFSPTSWIAKQPDSWEVLFLISKRWRFRQSRASVWRTKLKFSPSGLFFEIHTSILIVFIRRHKETSFTSSNWGHETCRKRESRIGMCHKHVSPHHS